jgi:signal transduction histidine kinase
LILLGWIWLRSASKRKEKISVLQATAKEKDQFLATVSHELRTPLTSVLGFLGILQDPASDAMGGPDQKELIDLADLVDDLLAHAKSEANQLAVEEARIDLDREMSQVLLGLRVGDHIAVSGPAVIASGDAFRFRQIARNLVTNAIKYGGHDIAVDLDSDQSSVWVAVSDDGRGVPEGEEANIFEAYRRAHDTPGLTDSMGLGLAVFRRLTTAIGGSLSYNRAGGRTVFKVSLPRYVETPTRTSAGALLVEDPTMSQSTSGMRVASLEDRRSL